MNKLELLKQYTSILAEEEGIWFEAKYITEALLQTRLRDLSYLIEEANEQQIIKFINKYKKDLNDR